MKVTMNYSVHSYYCERTHSGGTVSYVCLKVISTKLIYEFNKEHNAYKILA